MKNKHLGCIICLVAFIGVAMLGCQQHEHTYGEWSVTADATCTTEGVQTRTCECGDTQTQAIAATGHSFSDWTTTTAASCAAEGVETRTCSCGETETRTTGVTSHTYTDATCTEPKKCTVCNTTEGAANGHTFSEATCAKPKTCSICSATEGSALAHNFADGACTMCGTADPKEQQLVNARGAYLYLTTAEEYCDLFSSAIYDAWYFAIYQSDDYRTGSSIISAYSSYVGFETDLITEAVNDYLTQAGYSTDSDYQCAALRTNDGALYVVYYAFSSIGSFDNAEECLYEAKSRISQLSQEYASATAYNELSSYYGALLSYLDFCINPSGSFSQLSNTLGSFRNNCASYRNQCDLKLI